MHYYYATLFVEYYREFGFNYSQHLSRYFGWYRVYRVLHWLHSSEIPGICLCLFFLYFAGMFSVLHDILFRKFMKPCTKGVPLEKEKYTSRSASIKINCVGTIYLSFDSLRGSQGPIGLSSKYRARYLTAGNQFPNPAKTNTVEIACCSLFRTL